MSPTSPRLLVAVALGGAVGAVLRALAAHALPDAGGLPVGTLLINVAGSFLLATLPALVVAQRSPVVAAGIGAGLIGGFTTLSATSEQARSLLATGRTALAAAYVVLTLGAAVGAAALGDRLARRRLEPGR